MGSKWDKQHQCAWIKSNIPSGADILQVKNCKHARVMSDNITAVSYINNKGRD